MWRGCLHCDMRAGRRAAGYRDSYNVVGWEEEHLDENDEQKKRGDLRLHYIYRNYHDATERSFQVTPTIRQGGRRQRGRITRPKFQEANFPRLAVNWKARDGLGGGLVTEMSLTAWRAAPRPGVEVVWPADGTTLPGGRVLDPPFSAISPAPLPAILGRLRLSPTPPCLLDDSVTPGLESGFNV